MKKDFIFFIWLGIWFTGSLLVLFFTQGLGDHSDGLMHYMLAKYAHIHPENFLDPWAKTGYTTVAWPFAQFGLKGAMFMNILCAGTSMWLVYKISKHLQIKHAWIAFIVLSLSTYYFKLMFSGLTEHVFSLVLITVIYLLLKNKWLIGTLILSSLPFFRQEGYIIMAALIPFYLYKRKFRFIPLLSSAFILVGLIGGIYYHNMMWIVRSNPYGYSQSYGSGPWWAFCIKLYYNIGLVNLLFLILGIITLFVTLLSSRFKKGATEFLLVFFPFFSFFIAHSLFWYLGIFHSMGLQRVLNCVTPLMAIIAAFGVSKILSGISEKFRTPVMAIMTIPLVIYPFLPGQSNVNPKKDFALTEYERRMRDACEFINIHYEHSLIYAEHPLIPYFLDIDPFDTRKMRRIFQIDLSKVQAGDIILWENDLAGTQSGLPVKMLFENKRFAGKRSFQTKNDYIVVFECKQ